MPSLKSRTISVLENVDVGPACEVQTGSRREEVKGGRGQLGAALALQKGIELCLERVQIKHVGGGIGELLLAQAIGAPVGGLLLLGEIDAQKLLAQILQAEPVGECPGQAGGDLGAVDRRAAHAERMLEHGDVEAAEMEKFKNLGIGQQGRQVRRLVGSA